jgi:hypothetical protein
MSCNIDFEAFKKDDQADCVKAMPWNLRNSQSARLHEWTNKPALIFGQETKDRD